MRPKTPLFFLLLALCLSFPGPARADTLAGSVTGPEQVAPDLKVRHTTTAGSDDDCHCACDPGWTPHCQETCCNPRIAKAINALKGAIAELQAAPHDFGGHRTGAIEACQKALAQLQLALQYDRRSMIVLLPEITWWKQYERGGTVSFAEIEWLDDFGADLKVSESSNPRSGHPRISSAIRALEGAIDELRKAPRDFGGHRADAIEACSKAVDQLKLALAYGKD